jgi:hypothetical protein
MSRADAGDAIPMSSGDGASFAPRQLLHLQRTVGNAATQLAISRRNARAVQRSNPTGGATTQAAPSAKRIAFVREEGLNLREGAGQKSTSLAELKFGRRLHIVDVLGQASGWQHVVVGGQTGYVDKNRIHFPPEQLIQKDPYLSLVRVQPGQRFWGLVKQSYGVQGDEGTPDENINHFINAIRAVNKAEAFKVKTDWLDDIGNWLISGRSASDTELVAGVDLWIPSFGVALSMDVGSGTVTGETSRLAKKVQQKIEDFIAACEASAKYIPDAVLRYAGEFASGLLPGLIEFAKDGAKILAASTAIGALIGALFGGVGAIPGAEIGFEVGLLILEFYGLAMMIEAILNVGGALLSHLGRFISLVWTANGNAKQLEDAGKTLADALGILAAAVLVVAAALLVKKGSNALSKTRFAKAVGETRWAKWIEQRRQGTTTKERLDQGRKAATTRFPRTQKQLDDLARDPAHGKQIGPKGIREREAGLGCEARGDLPGPIEIARLASFASTTPSMSHCLASKGSPCKACTRAVKGSMFRASSTTSRPLSSSDRMGRSPTRTRRR